MSHELQMPSEVRNLMAGMMADIERMSNERVEREAKADPAKHRLTKVMRGPLRYRYFRAGKNGRGSKVRFCYSTGQNVAGYFLIWREVETAKTVKRGQWDATTSKRAAVRVARELARSYRKVE